MKEKELLPSSYYSNIENICRRNDFIEPDLFVDYHVYQGLRDINGVGVLTGLTNISKITSKKEIDGKMVPCDGELWYRGYPVEMLIGDLGDSLGFEKIAYLLLTGEMPGDKEYEEFFNTIGMNRNLPEAFARDVIMNEPSKDIMSSMTRSILSLAAYDKKANDNSVSNVLRQSIRLIGQFPTMAVYGYHAYSHSHKKTSMYIHNPDPKLSTAENFLRMLRPDKKYTAVEAKTLDTALILHMEHGGGNNSTFTTRVVTSSGSDTYSTIAAAMSSLKGPRHGGANIKVMEMMADIRKHVSDFSDKDEIEYYLSKILEGEAFDGKKLIYGMGHAIYALSDPRERVFKKYVVDLAREKQKDNDLMLYENIEEIAPKLIAKKRKIYKGVSPNVDFYSGFVYEMLGIPVELYTAMFGIGRIVGWSAHRIEELVGGGRIIRPAYMSVMEEKVERKIDE